MYKNEIAFHNHKKAFEVAAALLEESYVVLLSCEEDLIILDYEWSPNSDRNDMVFMRRDEFEENYLEIVKEDHDGTGSYSL